MVRMIVVLLALADFLFIKFPKTERELNQGWAALQQGCRTAAVTGSHGVWW